jgi:hypothetical protein
VVPSPRLIESIWPSSLSPTERKRRGCPDTTGRATVEQALAFWNRCEAYGTGFPSFTQGASGTRIVKVWFGDGSSGSPRCGTFLGATVLVLYLLALSGGRLRHCGPPSWLLAHELGHVHQSKGFHRLSPGKDGKSLNYSYLQEKRSRIGAPNGRDLEHGFRPTGTL